MLCVKFCVRLFFKKYLRFYYRFKIDGDNSMEESRKYLVAVALLAVLAVGFGLAGTFAPVSEEVSPRQSSSGSVTHFMNPPTYDSGWVNITYKVGQYFNVTHDLNTTEVFVDIVGKQSLGGTNGEHQRNLGGTEVIPGWSRTHGGANDEVAYSMIQTDDGGHAIAGYTYSYGAGSADFWLIKTDAFGNMEWSKTYGGTSAEEARSVVQTSDGGYAIAGATLSLGEGSWDFWLVKTDWFGNMEWSKTYGRAWPDGLYSMVQTSDGGYALAGYTLSFDAGEDRDFWLVKTDADGNQLWNKTYGGAGEEGASTVIQTGDGGYALTGGFRSYGAGEMDCWLIKTDSFGALLWEKIYGGVANDGPNSLVQKNNGGYVLAGFTESFGAGGRDFWLIETDTETGLAWTSLTNSTITLYRGRTDPYWNHVRVRMWLIREPTWQWGDINQDGKVDIQDLYILAQNYGKTFSLLSLTGIIAIAGIHQHKKRKQQTQT
jgi:hypothetical protein